MRIGVVADTHSREIPQQLLKDFQNVDFIIHAGDFCSVNDLNVFKKIGEVKAVYGNMDEAPLRKMLPEREIIEIDGFRIGLYHGEGPPKKVIDYVREAFEGKKLDAVVFGHSHIAMNEKINGTLYFNPGSPNDTITAPFCSYGILEIKKGALVGIIIKIKDK